ncbi:hypothetical protein CVT25_007548 [Psilocybe cyanescens]|uniref:CCHC-type domain-containing protein n=1 Tax=Psilocybe cyanescens TaxID=93625 RepID=A0A409X6S9_PSICY|nr:hypothetical protein CVT25_007548 [Psilocybe cyanescens]
MSTTITDAQDSGGEDAGTRKAVKYTYSSRARAALTRTVKNPNPQAIPPEDKPRTPRAAPSGSRARFSTSLSTKTTEGKKNDTAADSGGRSVADKPDHEPEEQAAFGGWQVPRSPARRSASPVNSGNVIKDDNVHFPLWLNEPLGDEKPEFDAQEGEEDNQEIRIPLLVKDATLPLSEEEHGHSDDEESMYMPEQKAPDEDNSRPQSPEVKSELGPQDIKLPENNSGEDHSSRRSESPARSLWSDYPEDNDIGDVPVFEGPMGGNQTKNDSGDVIDETANKDVNTSEYNNLDNNKVDMLLDNKNKDISAIAGKMDKLYTQNADLMEHQASLLRMNKDLRNELHRLKMANSTKGRTTAPPYDRTRPLKERSARASSILPRGSAVHQAITGDNRNGTTPPDDDGDGDKPPMMGSSDKKKLTTGKRDPPKKENSPRQGKIPSKKGPPSDPGDDSSSSGDSSDDESDDIFDEEPESVRSGDSESTKKNKRAERKRYRARIACLKYQQAFLKTSPPFIYNGEVQATLFKKWVREVRLWTEQGRIRESEGVMLAGKYLGGRAYQFFERDILALRKKYDLTEFFEKLFDYVFPVDFRMQQRDKFDACRQDNRSVLDFLRKLQEIADTIGDMEDRDIVLAFWRRSQPYLRVEMTKDGLDPTLMSISALEECAVRHERAHLLAGEEGKRGRNPTRFSSSRRDNVSSSTAAPVVHNSSSTMVKFDKDKKKPFGSSRRSGPSGRNNDRTKKLRAEGRCFQCESKEHLLKDCPQRINKRPPLRLANAEFVSPAEARLAAVDEGNHLGLFSAQLGSAEDLETLPEIRNKLICDATTKLMAAVPLSFDYVGEDAEVSPFVDHRFEFFDWNCPPDCSDSGCNEGTVELTDLHSYESHLLTFAQLKDKSFDITET